MEWGTQHRRAFPWRSSSDPYGILVAELLVQRTRADQVQPTYTQFIERWPTIVSLAKARPRDIRSVVETLGLDYRVKRISTVAQEIMKMFGGRIPDTLKELKQLYGRGFGDYMAHAILCFAFGQDVPIVDKNVERILKRVFSLATRADAHRDPKLWTFAGSLVPPRRAREYNWSLLDFGALVCTPKDPKCPICPLLQLCDFGGERMRRSKPA